MVASKGLHVILVLGLCGCSNAMRQRAAAAAPAREEGAAPRDEFVVIGRLVGRERTITMLAGPASPAYTVQGRDGKVLVQAVGEEELRAALPELYQQIKSSVAVGMLDGPRGFFSADARGGE